MAGKIPGSPPSAFDVIKANVAYGAKLAAASLAAQKVTGLVVGRLPDFPGKEAILSPIGQKLTPLALGMTLTMITKQFGDSIPHVEKFARLGELLTVAGGRDGLEVLLGLVMPQIEEILASDAVAELLKAGEQLKEGDAPPIEVVSLKRTAAAQQQAAS